MADTDDDKSGQGGAGGVTLDQVKELITNALGGKGGAGKAADAHDVSAQVEAAVKKVHEGAEAERVRTELEARVKKLEETKVPERKPREYRSVTRLIWGDDDDE